MQDRDNNSPFILQFSTKPPLNRHKKHPNFKYSGAFKKGYVTTL